MLVHSNYESKFIAKSLKYMEKKKINL